MIEFALQFLLALIAMLLGYHMRKREENKPILLCATCKLLMTQTCIGCNHAGESVYEVWCNHCKLESLSGK